MTPSPPVLTHRSGDLVLRVEPWGRDSVRVRAAIGRVEDVPGALLDRPAPVEARLTSDASGSALVVGALTVDCSAEGRLVFRRTADGGELLAEAAGHFAWPGSRAFTPLGGGSYRIQQRFAAYPGERFYGLGQHTHGRLDQRNLVLDLVQRNGEVSIPFALSSRGYGLLWNNPAVGRVELADNGTRWVADAARRIDYWFTAGDSPAAILGHYADATGHAPVLPEWATGFWQSRLRYRDQKELLDVAREHHRRGLPLSVIAVDYFHWPHLGDWRFDPADWPDPAGLVRELAELGVRPLLSVWPSVSPLSENYTAMRERGLLVGTEHGTPQHHLFPDHGFGGHALGVSMYDATDPEAREFLWERVRAHYYEHGFRVWWLDACEPEIFPEQFANLRFAAGPGTEVANQYPRDHVRGFHDHMRQAGEEDVVCLVRSAWAGSQRYGAALWSGDIPASFDSLAAQIRAGLNAGLSGIPWWTTDIGGFHGGDPGDDAYRELFIRWFQFAVFCPVTRVHGHREPRDAFAASHSGGPNELWSYGPDAYRVLAAQLRLRERLRPYVRHQMEHAARTGVPPMRPLFVDHPDDPAAWEADDQYLFGPDLLVAPVVTAGARSREVYLPAGADWTDPATGVRHPGGRTVTAAAPLERIPVFVRAGAGLPARSVLPDDET